MDYREMVTNLRLELLALSCAGHRCHLSYFVIVGHLAQFRSDWDALRIALNLTNKRRRGPSWAKPSKPH